MEEKLNKLYLECLDELNKVGIDVNEYGKRDISILSSRSKKVYGYCMYENPDISSKYIVKRGRRKYIKYGKFNIYHIKINKWTMSLKDEIIKNTIMHELVHSLPYANNHGMQFKRYASYINEKLGYNISRLGDKKKDFLDSNLEYNDDKKEDYRYIITCQKCNTIYKRKRITKDFLKKYRCSKCFGKLKIVDELK